MSLCSPARNRETIFFMARSLERGGAERQLVVLARGLAQCGYHVVVAVFFGGGPYEAELRAAKIPVVDLKKRGRWDVLPFLWRLFRALRRERAEVLHSYLSVPNVLAVLLKPFVSGSRVVWGVRASNMDLSRYDWLARLVYRLECRFAKFADLIIVNSHAGKSYAVGNGFPAHKIIVIQNGIDTEYFQRDRDAGQRLRALWGVKSDALLVGMVARLDPMKDHPTFFRAVRGVIDKRADLRFVCVGDGPSAYIQAMKKEAAALRLDDHLIWAGPQDDMPAVYSAFDVAVSSSITEGFPNTIAEAMACGTPCVVTDVGDSAEIVGALGITVLPARPDLLCDAILAMLDRLGPNLWREVRGSICSRFARDVLIQKTASALFVNAGERKTTGVGV